MRRIFAPAAILAVCLSFIPETASASRSYGVDNCSQQGCTEIKSERVRTYRTGKKSRSVRHIRSRSVEGAGLGGRLVSIQCGPRKISVARTASVQFEGFCIGLYSIYKFRVVGGYRAGDCHTGSKHGCGGAIDVEQCARDVTDKDCGKGFNQNPFPVAESELLADKWGLQPGSRWNKSKWSPDTGHFEIKGGLASNGWTPKTAEAIAAKAGEPAPKRWPVAHSEIRKDQERHPQDAVRAPVVVASADANHQIPMMEDDYDIALPFIDPYEISPFNERTYPPKQLDPPSRAMADGKFSYYVYTDTVPNNPARLAMEYLRNVPQGNPHQEVTRAAVLFGLDKAFLHALVKAESSYRPKERTGSYIGLCQLSKYEFKRYGGGVDVKTITDARANVIVCAHKLAVEEAIIAHATNSDVSAAKKYMAHQQGLEGATEHYSHPDRVAVDSMCATREGQRKGRAWCVKAICLNTLPSLRAQCRSITSGQFIAHWKDKIEKFMAAGVKAAAGVYAKAPSKKRYAKKYKTRYAHRKKHHIKYAAAR